METPDVDTKIVYYLEDRINEEVRRYKITTIAMTKLTDAIWRAGVLLLEESVRTARIRNINIDDIISAYHHVALDPRLTLDDEEEFFAEIKSATAPDSDFEHTERWFDRYVPEKMLHFMSWGTISLGATIVFVIYWKRLLKQNLEKAGKLAEDEGGEITDEIIKAIFGEADPELYVHRIRAIEVPRNYEREEKV